MATIFNEYSLLNLPMARLFGSCEYFCVNMHGTIAPSLCTSHIYSHGALTKSQQNELWKNKNKTKHTEEGEKIAQNDEWLIEREH